MKIAMTQTWKNKKTPAEPMAAKARISRGNDTFLTRPALLTITPVADITPVEKKFHKSNPENKKMTKSGMPFLRRTPKTRV